MRLLTLCAATATIACHPPAVRPDIVSRWNEAAIATAGPIVQRTLAMVHIAMFDAVNSVEPRYRPYLALPTPPKEASPEALAAAAAHGVLLRLFPERRQTLESILVETLAAVPEGARRREGLHFGDVVAQRMVAARVGDNIAPGGPTFTASSTPGRYQLTIPGPSQPINTSAPHWRPFVLGSASQFRPDRPPALTSATYSRDLAEVRRLGGSSSDARTLDQEEIARWHSEPVSQQFNRIARAETARDGRGLLNHARLFALLNLTLADALTSAFDAKYTYLFWRPVTAIRNADSDGNAETIPDATWSPFLLTPPHPEFPSEHSALQSAGARVMAAYFGESYAFQSTSPTVPGLTRSYGGFQALVNEGAWSRILAGVHFRAAVEAGALQGKQVADWVLDHCLGRLETD
jgi:hypothetical protein